MSEIISSPWIPAVVLLLLALAARAIRGTWLSPAAFVALVWATYVSGALLLADYKVYPGGVWVIVSFVFSVQFGTLLSEGMSANSTYATHPESKAQIPLAWSDRSFRFSILLTGVTVAGTIYLVIYSMDKFSLGYTPLEILSLGGFWSVERYTGGVEPWPVRLTIMWVYPAALLAGISFATARRRIQKYLSFAPFVPAGLVGTTFAARAGLLTAGVCWIAGFVAVRYCERQSRLALFQRKFTLALLGLMVFGVLFFITIDSLRAFEVVGGGELAIRFDPSRIYKYFFGAIPALSSWFHFAHSSDVRLGAYTFAGVFDLLGIKQRQLGIHEELITLAGGEETNIYTLFRSLIEDFTLGGTCVFGVLLGCATGSAARPRSAVSTTAALTLAAYYAFILFSPLGSMFAYNGLILAWVVAAFVLGFGSRRQVLKGDYPVSA